MIWKGKQYLTTELPIQRKINRLVEKVIPTSLGTWAGEKKKGMIDVLAFS